MDNMFKDVKTLNSEENCAVILQYHTVIWNT